VRVCNCRAQCFCLLVGIGGVLSLFFVLLMWAQASNGEAFSDTEPAAGGH